MSSKIFVSFTSTVTVALRFATLVIYAWEVLLVLPVLSVYSISTVIFLVDVGVILIVTVVSFTLYSSSPTYTINDPSVSLGTCVPFVYSIVIVTVDVLQQLS